MNKELLNIFPATLKHCFSMFSVLRTQCLQFVHNALETLESTPFSEYQAEMQTSYWSPQHCLQKDVKAKKSVTVSSWALQVTAFCMLWGCCRTVGRSMETTVGCTFCVQTRHDTGAHLCLWPLSLRHYRLSIRRHPQNCHCKEQTVLSSHLTPQ